MNQETRNIEVTNDEARLIYAMRRADLKPVTVLMDGIAFCNARKVNGMYNQVFFSDRGSKYEQAYDNFKETAIQEVGIPLKLGGDRIIIDINMTVSEKDWGREVYIATLEDTVKYLDYKGLEFISKQVQEYMENAHCKEFCISETKDGYILSVGRCGWESFSYHEIYNSKG